MIPELIELFRSSDVFVLPSRSDTFGVAAIEAASAGCRWWPRRAVDWAIW
jgi:glycosyltransferase involved in cell wall biosynthesis